MHADAYTNDLDELLMVLDADQWDAQSIISRMNDSLIKRGYVTWFDCVPSNVPVVAHPVWRPSLT